MKIILTIFALVVSKICYSYNPFWIQQDKRLINKVVQLDRTNPTLVEQFFKSKKCDTIKEKLGFGWEMWSTGIGGGYISIKASFYYLNTKIVSYSIYPEMPTEKKLIPKYKKWYVYAFDFNEDEIIPYHYNPEEIMKPLNEYKGNLTSDSVSKTILKYMSPISGTLYGLTGGYTNTYTQNRQNFIQIQDYLTFDEAVLLLYSINPASRLTAIELFYRKNYSKTKEIEQWINRNYIEFPSVETLFGCYRDRRMTKELVYFYSQINIFKE